MNDEDGREDLLTRCREQTGIDTTFAGIPAIPNRSTRKDREAVNRMMRTGITSRDIELERESGYYYGRNSGFFLSAGYAGIALLLSRPSSSCYVLYKKQNRRPFCDRDISEFYVNYLLFSMFLL